MVRIPAGASSIDIRQNGYGGRKKDDNYIAVRDVDTGEYLMNGGFILSMFKKSIQYGDVILDYTGSDTVTERLNSTKPIKKDLVVEVLTVGALNPPDIIFTYLVSSEKQVEYRWMTADRWSHCDRLCKGELVLFKPTFPPVHMDSIKYKQSPWSQAGLRVCSLLLSIGVLGLLCNRNLFFVKLALGHLILRHP